MLFSEENDFSTLVESAFTGVLNSVRPLIDSLAVVSSGMFALASSFAFARGIVNALDFGITWAISSAFSLCWPVLPGSSSWVHVDCMLFSEENDFSTLVESAFTGVLNSVRPMIDSLAVVSSGMSALASSFASKPTPFGFSWQRIRPITLLVMWVKEDWSSQCLCRFLNGVNGLSSTLGEVLEELLCLDPLSTVVSSDSMSNLRASEYARSLRTWKVFFSSGCGVLNILRGVSTVILGRVGILSSFPPLLRLGKVLHGLKLANVAAISLTTWLRFPSLFTATSLSSSTPTHPSSSSLSKVKSSTSIVPLEEIPSRISYSVVVRPSRLDATCIAELLILLATPSIPPSPLATPFTLTM